MTGDRLRQKDVPWCTLFLVVGAFTCHTLVYIGNDLTASAMNDIGSSTNGWSQVGLGISRSLRLELNEVMDNMSEQLLASLEQVMFIQDYIDEVLSLVGNTTEDSAKSTVSLLQVDGAQSDPSKLLPLIMGAVKQAAHKGVDFLMNYLHDFLEELKPALEKISEWIVQFGPKIQAFVAKFSTTLDRVQKIFDQIMSEMATKGENKDQLLDQTFLLFTFSGTGYVTSQDLTDVAGLYQITALQGDKPAELVEKYDMDGDNQLDFNEFSNMVDDETVPDIMATVLRTYSTRLAEIAGVVSTAKMRGDLTGALVDYFSLVCANNQSKVEWVSQRLSNASLPLAFSADVMIQLCLHQDNPVQLSKKDVGALVIGTMYMFNSSYTLEAVDVLANTSFWEVEGFDVLDQPRCLEKVTSWVSTAKRVSAEQALLLQGQHGAEAKEQRMQAMVEAEVLAAMPAMARRLGEESVNAYHHDRLNAKRIRHAALYATETSQLLAQRLLGRASASNDGALPTAAERAINAGQPAVPASLQFAKWLSNNATTNSGIMQSMCFIYTGQSSGTMDSFAQYIMSMVAKTSSFIGMMEKYATPAGFQMLADTISNFADGGIDDLLDVALEKIESLVNDSIPQVEESIKDAVIDVAQQQAGKLLDKVADVVVEPLGQALAAPLGKVAATMLNDSELAEPVGELMGPLMGNLVANISGKALDDFVAKAVGQLMDKAFDFAADALSGLVDDEEEKSDKAAEASLLALDASSGAHEMSMALASDGKGSSFDSLLLVLNQLHNILPLAKSTLASAKTEVSKAQSQMDSIFGLFEVKGPQMFGDIAKYWRFIWLLYFFVFAPLSLLLLYYGFWASGYCGGPQPIPEDPDDSPPPQSFRERVAVCCAGCCVCLTKFHDTQLCFWSVILLMQVLVLIIFLVSIVLCVLAGLKAFLTAGCAEIYMLGDVNICSGTLDQLKQFLVSFHVISPGEELIGVCNKKSLMTCKLITSKMQTSGLLTTVFSFVATFFSLQMLIESAVLHEMARYRRMAAKTTQQLTG